MNRVNIWWLLFLALTSPGIRNWTEALRCYACTYVASQQSDTTCIDNPEEITGQNIVNCDKKYCTILRQELLDPAGKVESFQRSCEDSPLFLNDVIEDSTYKTYFRSCTSDLCNNGDGISSGGSGLRPDVPGENILVPGLPNKGTLISSKPGIFISAFLFVASVSFRRILLK
uniref:15.9 kDa midgut protein n=1 Tax=Phlebotomus papatasi TaxID=29031 RepID=A8CAC7_PHLPP|nr:15.9 kDa midgut protein [Phlebotomus papatasi]